MKVANRSIEPKRATRPAKKNKARAHKDRLADYKPRTELGRKLLELRRQYFAEGGKPLTLDEIDEKVGRPHN